MSPRTLAALLAIAALPTTAAGAQTPPGNSELVAYAETVVGGYVPATLRLTLGPPATFGAFAPGVSANYTSTMAATTTSTGGSAVLDIADPSSVATGRLVNGSFALLQPLLASATSGIGFSRPPAAIGGSATPTPLLVYIAPVSNDAVTLQFSQAIAATEPLRTGTYSKTLIFTLSTSNP